MLKIILVAGTAISLIVTSPHTGEKNTTKDSNVSTQWPVQYQYLTSGTPTTTTTTTSVAAPLEGVDWVALARHNHGKCGEWYDTAMSAGWPEDQWRTISKVMWRESRCQPDAWNGHDAGLMQINQIHKSRLRHLGMSHPDTMFNPYWNLVFARDLWERAGWEPWTFKGVVPG